MRYLLCVEALFELDEYDEVGDGDGDHAGEGGPVHLEQAVPGHQPRPLYLSRQGPQALAVPRLRPLLLQHISYGQETLVEVIRLEDEESQVNDVDDDPEEVSSHQGAERQRIQPGATKRKAEGEEGHENPQNLAVMQDEE